MTNVLMTSCSNRGKRIKGLYHLVIEKGLTLVTPRNFSDESMFQFMADNGKTYHFRDLENWEKVYNEVMEGK
jgi:hypothetical protein